MNWTLWIVLAIGLSLVLIFATGAIYKLIRCWRTPTIWISALPEQGWVQVTGKVRGQPVLSPFTKTSCAYYQYEVKEYRSSGRGGGWHTIRKDSSGPFILDDMTGRINIQVGKPDVLLSWNGELPVDDSTRATLQSLGVPTKGLFGFNKRLKVFERLITPGDDMIVVAKLTSGDISSPLITKTAVPMLISNLEQSELRKVLSLNVLKALTFPIIFMAFVIVFIYLSKIN